MQCLVRKQSSAGALTLKLKFPTTALQIWYMWSSAVGPFTVTSNTVHSAWLDSKLHNVSLHNVPQLEYFSRQILIMQTGRLVYPSPNSWSPSWWRDVTGNDGLLECAHKKHQPPGRSRSRWFQTDRQEAKLQPAGGVLQDWHTASCPRYST